MKRMMFRISLVAAILLAAFPMVGQASEVTSLTAEQVARNFWNLHHDKDAAKLNSTCIASTQIGTRSISSLLLTARAS